MSSPRRALRFPDLSVLTVALTSGLVPAEVAARPARVWREADGTVYVVPAVPLEPEVGRVLAAAGVPAVKAESGGVGVVCWAEILPPRATGVPGDLPEVLFVVPDETSLLELAGELLRLGCDRQQLGAAGERFLLRAIAPPYYTVARALDRVGGLRAFVGRERVLTEIGWTHPLAALLRMSEDRLLLIEGDGRFTVLPAVGEWRDVYQRIELELPGGVAPLAARALSAKLRVPLRLARAGRPLPPSLWVLREDAEAQLDALVHTLPDEVIGRLLFAFAEALGGGAVAVVKARPGASGPPDLALRVAGHVPLLQIANLFVPADSILEPPLRRDVVQELLAPDPDVLAWLEPGDHGEPTLHSLPESALTPLEDWILYVVERGAEALEPWVQGATFAFEDFESTGAEWGEGPTRERGRRSGGSREHRPSPRPGPPGGSPARSRPRWPRPPRLRLRVPSRRRRRSLGPRSSPPVRSRGRAPRRWRRSSVDSWTWRRPRTRPLEPPSGSSWRASTRRSGGPETRGSAGRAQSGRLPQRTPTRSSGAGPRRRPGPPGSTSPRSSPSRRRTAIGSARWPRGSRREAMPCARRAGRSRRSSIAARTISILVRRGWRARRSRARSAATCWA